MITKEYKGELYELWSLDFFPAGCASCDLREECHPGSDFREVCFKELGIWLTVSAPEEDCIREKANLPEPLLDHCPSCQFTTEEFQRHKEFMELPPCSHTVYIEDYWPKIVSDPYVGSHVECENCGFVAWWPFCHIKSVCHIPFMVVTGSEVPWV